MIFLLSIPCLALRVAIVILASVSAARAADELAINQAVTWLEANSTGNSWQAPGSDNSRPSTVIRDTTSVLDALRRSGATSSSAYSNGMLFIQPGPPPPPEDGDEVVLDPDFDDRARTAWTLSRAGIAVADELTDLLGEAQPPLTDPSWRDYPGGGWGSNRGYSGNALDTALVLDALAPIGAGGMSRTGLVVPPSQSVFLLLVVPASATAINISTPSVSSANGVRIRLRAGSKPTASDQVLIFRTGNVGSMPGSFVGPLSPGVNWLRLDSPDAQSVTVSISVSYGLAVGETTAINTGLAFLRACQNVDGGFGIRPGDASSVYTTLVAVMTLETYWNFDSRPTLDAAFAYIRSKQNADGGIGSEPGISTPFETALAWLTIQRERPSDSAATRARDYLLATQSGGSWGDDPYSTALALAALTGADQGYDDADPVVYYYDNCPDKSNPDQGDADSDGIGNVCDDLCVGDMTSITYSDSTARSGATIRITGTGFGPNRQVWIGNVQSPFQVLNQDLLVTVPTSLPADQSYPVVVVNPEGCQSQEAVVVNITSGSSCGLLGFEPIILFGLIAGCRSLRNRRAKGRRD